MSIWEDYGRFRLQTARTGAVSYQELQRCLDDLDGATGTRSFELGRSWQQRRIRAVEVGTGTRQVLLWSQMHGDEPTHTVVLLELLRFLLSGDERATSLLSQLALTIVPMLNPDGAERGTRQNAQGIDINRDARRLASPEAEWLWRLCEERSFDFAFTLHNQRRSRTVDGAHLCALSLLVPPMDASHTETLGVRLAKQVGSLIRQATEPHAQGMLSRYVAGFMPRCFGEAIQMRGTSALLIEAGACPQMEGEWLTRLHLHAVVAGLDGLALGNLADVDTGPYETLPESNDVDLLDVLVRGVSVQDETEQPSAAVDLGILHEPQDGLRVAGKWDEVGDLEGRFGRLVIEAEGLVAKAAHVRFARQLRPSSNDLEEQLAAAARRGVEWVIGCYPLGDPAEVAALDELRDGEFLVDIGWIAIVPEAGGAMQLEALHAAREQGAVAVAAGADLFALSPRLSEQLVGQLRPALPGTESLDWPLPSRFAVGDPASCQLVRGTDPVYLIVRGECVLHDEQVMEVRPGRMLTGADVLPA
ncbi:MAG: M14 family zinc carboxypeptidase [Planctomycetota bacterium]